MVNTAYNINVWLEMMRPKYLTIKDILNMDPGQKETFLCIDRNFYDLIDHNSIGEILPPIEFLKNNYIYEYTHDHDLHGTTIWKTNPPEDISEPFNFDINYYGEMWYPLNDEGCLPYRDSQGLFSFATIKRDYKEYDDDTLIGWRGPMINMNDVINSPHIYLPNT
jgi:hypothetical protein